MYELFEHTADVGLRMRAADLKGLMEDAGHALFSVITANLDDVRPVQQVQVEIVGDQADELLRDWLGELLYIFHTRHLLLSRFEVELTQPGLKATAWGEPVDPGRHQLDVEIKAVTWHGLTVQQEADGWMAEVIVDI